MTGLVAFKWTLVALWTIGAIFHIRDAARHGQPKGAYNATHEAVGAALQVGMIAWALTVLP